MARNYILGGMAATQLQAGKPFFKRITRTNGTGLVNPAADPGDAEGQIDHPGNLLLRADDPFTCQVIGGKIDLTAPAKSWAGDGELLMVEFPTTLRSVQVQLEEATTNVRAKVMLTAPGQNTKADGTANAANPVGNGNYIEIKSTETATISSRTKVIFILIEKFAAATIFSNGQLVGKNGTNAAASDVASILITGVLDHEPKSGASHADNEPNSIVIDANGERPLRKIWGATDGIG